jgi:chromosome segregation ATPase
MPIPTIEELKEEIYSLPDKLNRALERKVKAQVEVSRLETEVEKLEVRLKQEKEQSEAQDNDDNEDEDTELIEMEAELKKLKVQLDEAESRAELDFRRNTPKTTENQVKATVCADENVSRLKLELIEQEVKVKTKKQTLQRERREAWLTRRPSVRHVEVDSSELDSLLEELAIAESKLMMANIEVETLQAKLDAFKMLIPLITI